jgi:branched-chain amino acid transport system permease protein
MDLVATILVDGLIYAGWLFIVSVGLTLVFGVLNILNIAHGSLYAIGAYAAASLVGVYVGAGGDAFPWGSYLALIVAALLVALILGPALERGLLRFFYGRDEVLNVLVTYAVFLILEDVRKLIWGVNPYFVYEPYTLHDPEMSRTMGVNVPRIYLGAFVAGAFLAALGGALTAPMISVTPGLGVNVIIVAFAVVIIGGLGSIPGAAIGAIMVGVSRAASVHLLPEAELFIIYFVMAIVLMFRPEGLFAKTQARKI